MAQNFDSVPRRKDVAEDIPQAGDHVEAGVPAAKLFRPDSPAASARGPLAAHSRAWLQQYEFLQPGRLRYMEGARAVTRSYIEQRSAAMRNLRHDNLVDSIQIGAPAVRQSGKIRSNPIIGLDGFEKDSVERPVWHHFRNGFSIFTPLIFAPCWRSSV